MGHEEQLTCCRLAHGDETELFGGMVGVAVCDRERVEEDSRGFLKGDTVFLGVGSGLGFVPLILEHYRILLPFQGRLTDYEFSGNTRANARVLSAATRG